MNLERLTKDEIKAQILGVEFVATGKITMCILTSKCGYQIIGTSGTIDTSKFDVELGNKYALEDAFNKLWAFEAYYKERSYRLENPFDEETETEAFRKMQGNTHSAIHNLTALNNLFFNA